jgi:hypothetical protein
MLELKIFETRNLFSPQSSLYLICSTHHYDGCVGTKEAPPVLFTALRSFKEAWIDDDNKKFAEMGAFLLDDEINSLLNKITALDAGLSAGRDRILRIGAHKISPRKE